MRENFKITDKETGKEYWISRSMAVTGIIVAENEGKLYFLVQKRGPGCPDFVGSWCNCCGYLGWDETRREAVLREIYEETGLDYRGNENSESLIEWTTMDDPNDNSRQNVTTRYILIGDYEELSKHQYDFNSAERGGEVNEVAEIKLIPEDDIDNYEWAWNHGELLHEIVKSSIAETRSSV